MQMMLYWTLTFTASSASSTAKTATGNAEAATKCSTHTSGATGRWTACKRTWTERTGSAAKESAT
ncbi:hypothetical protein DPMN_152175 [Dreissena polymorpha]|uniref:Secreted protein n=1 Tax=Dreissena polymorpha TaxID=45954 RepID=A0A9D4J4X6_DREPO|nr:hypothetical protein DPMN_152175 [Dreissena polymorpha]